MEAQNGKKNDGTYRPPYIDVLIVKRRSNVAPNLRDNFQVAIYARMVRLLIIFSAALIRKNTVTVVINPRRACAARVTVVGSVCLSVKSHLTYGASVRPENAVTYSAGNEGQKICGVFLKPMRCRDPALPPLYGRAYSRPFFLRKAARMRIIVFTTCGGGPKRPFLPSSCAELKVVVSFVSCHWSYLQARSVHNVMLLYR